MSAMFDLIAKAVARLRASQRVAHEFDGCSREEIEQIAHDVGVSPNELRILAERSADSASGLPRMMVALGIDGEQVKAHEPQVMRDLERLCSGCRDKGRCERDLAGGTAPAHYHDYCPNNFTLDAIKAEQSGTL